MKITILLIAALVIVSSVPILFAHQTNTNAQGNALPRMNSSINHLRDSGAATGAIALGQVVAVPGVMPVDDRGKAAYELSTTQNNLHSTSRTQMASGAAAATNR